MSNKIDFKREFLEKKESFSCEKEFYELTRRTKKVSDWAADLLGFKGPEKERYMRVNVANIIRNNQVIDMIKRIEKDLFNANIDIDRETIIAQVKK